MTKPLNSLAAAVKPAILLGFGAFFVYTVVSGRASLYVHPRINPFLIFAAAVMAAIAAVMLKKSLAKGVKNLKPLALLFYIIPLGMAFFIPAEAISSGPGGVALESAQTSQTVTLPDEQSGLFKTDGVIVFTDDNFYSNLTALTYDYKSYIGQRVELVGFVFFDGSFAQNEFVPARMLMTCCAADMSTVGLLCRYEGAHSLRESAWVRVTGVISAAQYGGAEIPCIEADLVETTDQPARAYVYPY